MAYASVDALQKTLADSVFSHTKDKKKAAGRALGTLVELVTYYTLRAWGFRDHIVIERSLAEYANREISHNVEFSLHPIAWKVSHEVSPLRVPITAAKLRKQVPKLHGAHLDSKSKGSALLSSNNIMRHSAVLLEDSLGPVVANIDTLGDSACAVSVCHLYQHPFAIFECKRVGIEDGMRKGPQTIEKAKQGAYVARSVSSLQKIRMKSGEMFGFVECPTGEIRTEPYDDLLREIVESEHSTLLNYFILTVGVVSNHGNWFTSTNANKELRVLAQSYDWLLFLTDTGLSQFIEHLLLNPTGELAAARRAFLASYTAAKGKNRFTKVKMDVAADAALRQYFLKHEHEVETWFNVISPMGESLTLLRKSLDALCQKPWKEIIAL